MHCDLAGCGCDGLCPVPCLASGLSSRREWSALAAAVSRSHAGTAQAGRRQPTIGVGRAAGRPQIMAAARPRRKKEPGDADQVVRLSDQPSHSIAGGGLRRGVQFRPRGAVRVPFSTGQAAMASSDSVVAARGLSMYCVRKIACQSGQHLEQHHGSSSLPPASKNADAPPRLESLAHHGEQGLDRRQVARYVRDDSGRRSPPVLSVR